MQPKRLVTVDSPPGEMNISLRTLVPAAQSHIEYSEDLADRQVMSKVQGGQNDDTILRRSSRQIHRPVKYSA